ncbi:hypothetical protein RI367_005391 [Sorochytrium milnesiophthora]
MSSPKQLTASYMLFDQQNCTGWTTGIIRSPPANQANCNAVALLTTFMGNFSGSLNTLSGPQSLLIKDGWYTTPNIGKDGETRIGEGQCWNFPKYEVEVMRKVATGQAQEIDLMASSQPPAICTGNGTMFDPPKHLSYPDVKPTLQVYAGTNCTGNATNLDIIPGTQTSCVDGALRTAWEQYRIETNITQTSFLSMRPSNASSFLFTDTPWTRVAGDACYTLSSDDLAAFARLSTPQANTIPGTRFCWLPHSVYHTDNITDGTMGTARPIDNVSSAPAGASPLAMLALLLVAITQLLK